MKEERVAAASAYRRAIPAFAGDRKEMVEAIHQALYASKIISYAQGYSLMRTAAEHYGWNLNYGRHRPHVARRLYHPKRFPG